MSTWKRIQLALFWVLVAMLLASASGCVIPPPGSSVTPSTDGQPSVYGSWQSSSGLLEQQLMRGSAAESSGSASSQEDSAGSGSSGSSVNASSDSDTAGQGHFRGKGEPVAIHQFVNRVLVDDEYVKITLLSKTADELGDAGFLLSVENRYRPLTQVGVENYCYLTPLLGTWTVNGVPLEARADDRVYPGEEGLIYLYFDELSTIEELIDVQGEFEFYYISDWWNPIHTVEIVEP